KAVVQERYEALAELQDRISAEENAAIVGREVNVLVASGEGRKDAERHRSSGRAEDGRLVHFDVPVDGPAPRPGDVVTVTVTKSAPHFLIADSTQGELRIRRTRAGDAWDRAEAESCAVPVPGVTTGKPGAVSLGLPTLRRPAG